jgi:hypothetical protein
MVTNRAAVTILCVIIAIISLSRLFCAARDHLVAPFDVVFETPHICTIKAIQKGHNIYDPAMYKKLPFILTIYTPAYHYLVAWLPQHPNNQFFTGRIVAGFFMILASLSLFFPYKPRENVAASILAIGCFFLIREVVSHAMFMRNDSMALFFSAAAVVWAEKADKTPWKIVLVSLLCVVAFSSKQSFVAATGTCFFYFLTKKRQAALIFGASSLFLLTIFGLFAQFYWGEGFWFSVLVAPRNPLSWQRFVHNWDNMLRQPFFCLLLFSTIAASTYFVATKKWEIIKESPFFFYFLFSALVLIMTLGKVGANVNYFFEPILAGLLLLVFLIKKLPPEKTSNAFHVFLCLLCIVVILEFAFAKRSDYSFTTRAQTMQSINKISKVKNEIRELHPVNGKILSLVWPGLILELQEEPVMNDLFLYSILWNTGVLSVEPLMNEIIDQYFDIIVLPKDQYLVLRDKYLGNVLQTPYEYMIGTVLAGYQLKKEGTYCYFVPKTVS